MKKVILFLFIFISSAIYGQEKTLDYFIQQAMANSPLFIENKNQIESLRADSLQLRAGYRPQVLFDSYNMYAPVVNGYGFDRAITNGAAVSAVVGLNVSIVGKNNLKNQIQNISYQASSLIIAGKLSERDLKKSITGQYITIYGEQKIIQNNDEILNALNNENAILKKLSEEGVYRETDYLSFLVTLKQQELSKEQQILQLKNDLALLNYSCGIMDTSFITLGKPELETKSAIVSENALFSRQYVIDSLLLANKSQQIKFDYKPHINLFGDAGYNSSLAYQSEKNFGASLGLHMFVPIYDGHLKDLRYLRIKLSESTRVGYLHFFRKQYSQNIMRIQQQLSSIDQIVSDVEKQYEVSDALVRANRKLLLTGDAKIVDYILALINYISTRSTIEQMNTNKLHLINEFNYLNY